MNDEKIEIKEIQQELKQLTQKHLELSKVHQQRVLSYKERIQAFEQKVKDYVHQKSLHQRLFGQPPLQPDPELLVDPELSPDPELQSVKEEIARLERDKENYFKILQAAASIPPPVEEKDWSNSPLYSKTVQKLVGANTPFEQYGLYGSIIGGMYLISRSLFRSYHAVKAIEFPLESQERFYHSFLSGATGEQLRFAQTFAFQLRIRGFLSGILLPFGFITYIVQKHKK